MDTMPESERRALRDAALAGGDAARTAFGSLWERFRARLVVYARSWKTLGGAGSEDAVSEALIAAFRGLARYDPARPIEPWVYAVASRRFADLAREAKRRPARAFAEGELDSIADPSRAHDELLVRGELADRVRAAIADLPEAERRLAVLAFYEELSSADIGRVLAMPPGTVRWRISVLRRRLEAAFPEAVHAY
ncbi:MAG: RNA polymerase sigma factor [Spirochaetales bacterium]|nr:RNA polymerase sigma factor [Spirochaetales bacterium]